MGYSVAFLLEANTMKWWLTRFLLPATATCLMRAVLTLASTKRLTSRELIMRGLLVVFATFAPVAEFARTFDSRMLDIELGTRLRLLVQS
jgi:hypothetical protein